MKKKALFAVLGIILVLLSVFAVIYFTRDASRPADPVEEAMKTITVYTEEGFHLYLSEDGSYYTFGGVSNFEGTELVIPAYYNGIPITKISNGALTPNRKNLKSVSIPDTVTEINSSLNFNYLEEYPLEFNQYEHGYYLGNENNPYHALMIYDPNYGRQAKVHPDTKVLSYGAFDECKLLTEVILPDGLLSIGALAFLRCESLKQITIPDSVTHVGEYTFSQCSSIEKVVLGSGITEISDRMFARCSSLTSVELRGTITRIGEQAFAWTLYLESFEIPESVTEVAANAFKNSLLQNVIIHKGVKSISIAAFPKSVEYNEYRGGLYLGDSQNPYLYLVGIKDTEADSLVLHPDTYSVSQQIIPMTSALTSLSVEGGKGKYLYSDGNCIIRKEDKTLLCGIGTSVIPQKGIKEIAPYAFTNCENLKNAVIPDTVKIIGEYAFYKCKNLESVTIPKSVLEIPEHCFYSCDLLSEVILSDKTEIIEEAAFSECKTLKNISLPGVKVIRNAAFMDCKALEKVSFSNELGYIGVSAFYGCTALKDIVLPYGLRYIGSSSFKNCYSIKYLNIPKSVENFGSNVYAQCNSLEYAIIPEGVERLSAREFELCTGLKKISLPSTLKTISGYAVLGLCESIEQIVYNGTVEEWNAIEKSDAWYIATPACKVICTDGEVELPANESDYVGSW
ncbi:MAG: leucine-rich repeat protein [Clostridia bacterium]|nr:leucine-rich repeat protein [Clostridia bacterium]